MGEKVTHHALYEIIPNLHVTRIERREADEELDAVLAKLSLNGGAA